MVVLGLRLLAEEHLAQVAVALPPEERLASLVAEPTVHLELVRRLAVAVAKSDLVALVSAIDRP